MRALHPPAELPQQIPRSSRPEIAPITELEIRRWLARFPRGTSHGPFGWRFELAIQLVRLPGANVGFELAIFFTLLVEDELGQDITEAAFSARLLAVIKSMAGVTEENLSSVPVRPIACGEIFRRLAGKIMLSRVSDEAATYLCTRKQLGVGVKGGIEAITHAVQKLIRAYLSDPITHARKVYVKADLRNAYNIFLREKMLQAARARVPGILPYLSTAYTKRTTLHFGSEEIFSESGVQQGCPGATLGFSLVLSEACSEIPQQLHDSLDLEAYIADDSNLGGDIDNVLDFVNALEALGPQYGYESRRDKMHVYCNPDLHAEASQRFGTTNVSSFEEAHTLGAPVGTQMFVDQFASRLLEATKSTYERITKMNHMHKAASVLALCGRGIATHLVRCSLPQESLLHQFDAAFTEAASVIYNIPHNVEVANQLGRRYTDDGGQGYRPVTPYARAAYMAADQETRVLQSLILRPEFMENTISRLLADPAAPALDATVVAAIRATIDAPPGRQLQRKWSRLIDQSRHTVVEDPSHRARLLSCSGSHLATHPIILQGETFEWLNNEQCTVITRMRFGLPIYDREQLCPLCRNATSDIYGQHVLSCLHGGHHTRAHNAACKDIAKLAGRALVSPTVESHCFPDAPSRRIDVFMRGLTIDRKPTAVDYALVSHASYNIAAAASGVGGACTAYEAVKHREYGLLAQRAGIHLAPMIQDTYGAWGHTALDVLAHLARRIADREGNHRGTVSVMNHRWLLSRLQCRVANHLLLATPDTAA